MLERFIIVVLATLLQSVAGQALAYCSGRLDSGFKAGGVSYDPFDPNDRRDMHTVTIRNTASVSCRFFVAFVRVPTEPKLDNVISYALEDSAASSLISGAASGSSKGLRSGVVAAGAVANLNYYVTIPRGQFAGPGTYDDHMMMYLFNLRDDGGIDPMALDSQALEVERQVPSSLSVNLAGGGLATTVNFADLVEGKEQSIFLQARANRSYRLQLESKNHGELKLDPPIPGEEWNVSYRVRVDGADVDLQPTVGIADYQTPVQGEGSHALSFRILDVSKKRAGIYKDTVTIKISTTP